MSHSYLLLTDELQEQITHANQEEQALWLILSPHPDSCTHWIVNCLCPEFYFDFEKLIGEYRAVKADTLDDFMELADELGYHIAFEEDPQPLLDAQARLEDRPDFELNSTLDGTIDGFLPFQLREFNRLKDRDYGLAIWSTGTGKTVFATAATIYHVYHKGDIDIAFHVVKRHNLINTQRKLKRLANIDSFLVSGPKKWRERVYQNIIERLELGRPTVVVLNYEKFRDDFSAKEPILDDEGDDTGREKWILSEWGKYFFPDRRLLFIWDEMPMKLKNRRSALYAGVCNCLYDTKPPRVSIDSFRPASTIQYMTSGTPIEKGPDDVFNCLRLMDQGRTLGSVREFEDEYVSKWNFFNPYEPEAWHNLHRMHLKIDHCLSIVDKTDPEIASMFPDMIEEPIYIDWNEKDRKVYDYITKQAKELLEDEEAENVNPLSLITVLQMMCDAPSMLNISAGKREEFEGILQEYIDLGVDEEYLPLPYGSEIAMTTIAQLGKLKDDNHEKLKYLERLLTERHPDEKALVYSGFNEMLLPILSANLTKWKINHVIYNGSDKQKQEAFDHFKLDPDIRVFLSSDAGSDSIDLEEASVTVDYDLPWAYSRMIQRRNRASRVTSQHRTIYCYSLIMADSVEDRRVKRIATKLGYHEGIFKGVPDDAIKATRLDKGDIYYILTGHELE